MGSSCSCLPGYSVELYPAHADLSGKVVLVTGGNVGLGYATAKVLAMMGTHTIITCRTREMGQEAVDKMKEEVRQFNPDKSINVEWMLLELTSFQATRDFTVAFKERNLPLHVLINNAGVGGIPFKLTEDGHETHLQVNHLGPLLLTLELLPIIMDTASTTGDGRIVFVGSLGHKSGQFSASNLEGEIFYDRFQFYFNSKLFTVMTSYALQRRLQNMGITVSCLHPGIISTTLGSQYTDNAAKKLAMSVFWKVMSPFLKTADEGAAVSVNCAANPALNSQTALYYDGSHGVKQSSPLSRDEAQQEQLWEISINMIKEFLTPELMQRYGPTLPVDHQEDDDTLTPSDKETLTRPAQALPPHGPSYWSTFVWNS